MQKGRRCYASCANTLSVLGTHVPWTCRHGPMKAKPAGIKPRCSGMTWTSLPYRMADWNSIPNRQVFHVSFSLSCCCCCFVSFFFLILIFKKKKNKKQKQLIFKSPGHPVLSAPCHRPSSRPATSPCWSPVFPLVVSFLRCFFFFALCFSLSDVGPDSFLFSLVADSYQIPDVICVVVCVRASLRLQNRFSTLFSSFLLFCFPDF